MAAEPASPATTGGSGGGSVSGGATVDVFAVDPDVPWGHDEALTAPLPLARACRWPGGFCAPFADPRAEAEYIRFLYAYNTTSGALLIGCGALSISPGLLLFAQGSQSVTGTALVLSGCGVALLGAAFLLVVSKLIDRGTLEGSRLVASLHRLCVPISLGLFGLIVHAVELNTAEKCDYVPKAFDPDKEIHPDCSNTLRDYVVFGLIVLAAASHRASDGVLSTGLLLVLHTASRFLFAPDSEEDPGHVLVRRTAVSGWITVALWVGLQTREAFYRRRFAALVSAYIDAGRNRRRITDVRRLVAAQLPASLARRLAESSATETAAIDIGADGALRLPSALLRDARNDATVLVTQVADYEGFAAQFVDPCQAPTALGHIFALFDVGTSVFGVDRTGAYGDAYTAAVNLFDRPRGRGSAARAVRQLARFALWQQGLEEARMLPLKGCLVTGELRGAVVGGARSLRFVLSGAALISAWQVLASSVRAGQVWACPESTRLATTAAAAPPSEGGAPSVSARSGRFGSRNSFVGASESMTSTAAASTSAALPTMRIVPCDVAADGSTRPAAPPVTSPAVFQSSVTSNANLFGPSALGECWREPITAPAGSSSGDANFRLLAMEVVPRPRVTDTAVSAVPVPGGSPGAASDAPPAVHYTLDVDAIVRTVLADRAREVAIPSPGSPLVARVNPLSPPAGQDEPEPDALSATAAAVADTIDPAAAEGQQDRLGWTSFVDPAREQQYRQRAAAHFPQVQHDAAVTLVVACVVVFGSHTADVAFLRPELLPEPASAGIALCLALLAGVIVWARRYRGAADDDSSRGASARRATTPAAQWRQAPEAQRHFFPVLAVVIAAAAYCWSMLFLAGSFHRNVATLHYVFPYVLAVTSFRHVSAAVAILVITPACIVPVLGTYWDTDLRYAALPSAIVSFVLYVLAVGYSQRLSFAATMAAERAEASVLATVNTMYSVLDGLAPRHVSLRAGVPRRPRDAAAAEEVALTFLTAAADGGTPIGEDADVEQRLAQLGAVMRGDHSKLGHDHYDTVTVATIAFRCAWRTCEPPAWSAEDDSAIAAAISAALETADPLDRDTPRVRVLRAMGRYVMLGAGFHDDQPPTPQDARTDAATAASASHSRAQSNDASAPTNVVAPLDSGEASEDAASPPATVLYQAHGNAPTSPKSSALSRPIARGTIPMMPAHEGAATLVAVLRAVDAHLALLRPDVVFEASVASEEAFGGLVGHGFMHYGVWGCAVSQSERVLEAGRRQPNSADFGPQPAPMAPHADASRIVVMPATHRLLEENRGNSCGCSSSTSATTSPESQASVATGPLEFSTQQPWAVHGLPFVRPRTAMLVRPGNTL